MMNTSHGSGVWVLIIGLLAMCQCQMLGEAAAAEDVTWAVGAPVLRAGVPGTFDDVAVKDPTMVVYHGHYHLFYTSKQRLAAHQYRTALGYVSAPTLQALNQATRHDMHDFLGMDLIAPQLFYFAPQQLWYLIAHIKLGDGRELAPVYATNPELGHLAGWSKPRILKTARTRDELWIDFWVICDDEQAHLFYSNQKGEVLRMACPLDSFPHGFTSARETVAFGPLSGEDERGTWRLFEAQHVYRVKRTNRYFMLVECAYERPRDRRPYPVDSRSRFLIGLVADQLEGPWSRMERHDQTHWATAGQLGNPDGTRSRYSLVSHPELIRSGYDQRLEIGDFDRVEMLFQSFDGTEVADSAVYDDLPWEIAVMSNQ
jgi:endo-1,4-beta-xylanase